MVDDIQNGYTHIFIMEFENEADRDYYAHEDPGHTEYKNGMMAVVDGAQVLDFTPGVVL